jgi:hypothetical protein
MKVIETQAILDNIRQFFQVILTIFALKIFPAFTEFNEKL